MDNGFWIIPVGVFLFFGGLITGDRGRNNICEKQAIEAKVAEYRVDSKTGEVTFVYLKFDEKGK